MSDLIDREAAIDAIKKSRYLLEAMKKVIKLPPAEPEIIRCKDCKWCEDCDGLMCKNIASWVVATDSDFGCVYAERRTDE